MRRFLSWIVLYILNFIFYILEFYVWRIAVSLFSGLYASSRAIFFVVLFLGGGELLLGLIYYAIFYGGDLVIRASQGTWRSRNGTRYKVVGVLNIITYAAFIALVIYGGAAGAPLIVNILAYLTMIVFGIVMITTRHEIVDDYGQPLSKRERLQAKIDKLDNEEKNVKEYHGNINRNTDHVHYCPQCGSIIPTDSVYCQFCGHKLK